MTEYESDDLWEAVAGRNLATSRVAVVEVTKAVRRVDPEANPEVMLTRMAFVELDAELATTAAAVGGVRLRALDAIHVASALRLGPELEAFITYDDRQADAAREHGFTVKSPGQQNGSPP